MRSRPKSNYIFCRVNSFAGQRHVLSLLIAVIHIRRCAHNNISIAQEYNRKYWHFSVRAKTTFAHQPKRSKARKWKTANQCDKFVRCLAIKISEGIRMQSHRKYKSSSKAKRNTPHAWIQKTAISQIVVSITSTGYSNSNRWMRSTFSCGGKKMPEIRIGIHHVVFTWWWRDLIVYREIFSHRTRSEFIVVGRYAHV